MADITMPQLGETVTEGTITRWFKEVGDQIAADETLFEVSTDKVDSEVPSPLAGYLTEILVPAGGTVAVGATLAVVSEAPAGADDRGAPARSATEQVEEPPVSPDDTGGGEGGDVEAEEAAAAETPSDTQGETSPTTGPATDRPGAADEERQAGPRVTRLLSPVVRRLAAEHGLDIDALEGTGAGGRITRNDVQAAISSGDGRTAPATRAATSAPRAVEGATARRLATTVAAGDDDEVVPFSNIRRRTAEHMTRSKATSAHTLIVMEVDYEGVDRVRTAKKDRFKEEEGISLTYLPFVSRAVVDALREFPYMNASVGEDHLVVHRSVHLGIAVDLHFEGLVAPVVHGAGEKRLRALAREIAELASQARSRKLGPDDIAGGTFTITNPGPFGTLLTGAIINQPQVAILSTDGVKKRPVAVELADGSDAIAVHPVGNLALTFDHRAVDGAYAAAFVGRIKDIVQTRDWLAELA
ncbi:MAG TPA: dihydrolipoamide acetyltransferase family protein [Acidimicrobiales bacterium]|nr:dihydrolipoamide acetyltransferase family protein [Acidimicrobiales bacterium]